MRLHREGTPTLLLSTAVLCFVLFALWNWPVLPPWLAVLISSALCLVFAIIIWFFRVPSRNSTFGERDVVSPCDGKVVVIEEVHEPFLIMQGFLKRTPRGREALPAAYTKIGAALPRKAAPATGQPELGL